jgi:hypothetical protein
MSDYRINREDLWLAILEVRHRQDERHGGPEHDDTHSRRDWVSLITRYLGKADRHAEELSVMAYQDAMLNVAALAIAAIESVDRIASKGNL